MSITTDRRAQQLVEQRSAELARTGGHTGHTEHTESGSRGVETAPGAQPRAARDSSVDAVRAILLCVVVGLHSLMVGVSIGADGPVLENALEAQAWFAPVSWLVQIMPLFFLVGGFSSVTQWRKMRGRGATPAEYIRARNERLMRPAIVVFAAVTVALASMLALGLPAEIVATAGFRISQPLWFLAVYIGCSALVPLMVSAHEAAPARSLLLLLGGVVATDAVRLSTGIDAVGLLNLAFVWLLLQQLGFWLADGRVDALARGTRIGVLVAAFCGLAALTLSGLYSPDMLVNLNPPTVCLVFLGVVQLMAFSLLQPRLRAWAARPGVAPVIAALGSRAMTVYLWHMPVLIALAAALLALNAATGMPLPEPLTLEWWLSRPLWLVLVGAAVALLARTLGRFEQGRTLSSDVARSPRLSGADAALGAAAVVLLLATGFSVWAGAIAVLALAFALRGVARPMAHCRTAARFATRTA